MSNMKKQFSNPYGIGGAILAVAISLVVSGAMVATSIKCFDVDPKVAIWLCVIILPVIVMCPVYLIKYGGYFLVEDDCLILKKGRRREKIAIKDIRWVEVKPHNTHSWAPGRPRKNELWEFWIRLNGEKKNLNYLITNQKFVDVIKEYNIRMISEYLEKEILLSQPKIKWITW